MLCEQCSSKNLIRKGTRGGKVRYKCKDCGKWTSIVASGGNDMIDFASAFGFGEGFRDDDGTFTTNENEKIEYEVEATTGNALFIGDSHEPFSLPGYIEHCARIRDRYKLDTVYHVGDIVDNHAISYHEHDPDGWSAGHEAEQAQKKLERWYELFPQMRICVGNHCGLPTRKAITHGLPKRFIKSFLDAFNAPKGYEYEDEYWHGGVLIIHGIGFGGQYGHINAARNHMASVVMGHLHATAGVGYIANSRRLIFGMATGCGIDRHAYAMAYGKPLPRKPIISCAKLIDGIPSIEPMPL